MSCKFICNGKLVETLTLANEIPYDSVIMLGGYAYRVTSFNNGTYTVSED